MDGTPDFISLGVGGVIAGFIFLFYRRDVRDYVANLKSYSELWQGVTTQLINVIKDNTASNTELILLIREDRISRKKRDANREAKHRTS